MQRRNFLGGLAVTAAGTVTGHSIPSTGIASSANLEQPNLPAESSEKFTSESRARSGIALGGIGAGSLELRKNGRFYNWSIFNNLPKETGPMFRFPEDDVEDPMASALFFKVRYQTEGGDSKIALLQLPDGLNEGGVQSIAYIFPWMQAVDRIDSTARFPFMRLRYSSEGMPFEIELEAWSPFIPHDVKNSSLPLVYFDFTLKPRDNRVVDAMLVMCARNTVGYDSEDRFYTTQIREQRDRKTVVMSCGGMDRAASTWGEITLGSLSAGSTHYTGWALIHPYYEYVIRNRELPNLDDTDGKASLGIVPPWMPVTSGRNYLDPLTGAKRIRKSKDEPPARLYCSIAKSFRLHPGESAQHTFTLSWNFPNLYSESGASTQSRTIEGHYYSNFFSSVFDVADYAAEQRPMLLQRTRSFQEDFFNSSIDVEILEQINSHLNTFVTSGRLVKNGSFGILEGITSAAPWGPIATIDVMLYGTAPIIALFPELQLATMRCHARVQSAAGEISHGLLKNFASGEDGTAGVSHRLDLPGQFVILALRDFFWTGDRAFLEAMYPHVQRAIEYVIQHRAPAGNGIPIMRGIECSYDNFPMYGYASYLLSQWICGLASVAAAAEILGDTPARARYEIMLRDAQKEMERSLWNGSYYRLYNDRGKLGGDGGVNEGILSDQLVGQWLAHQTGMGHLLSKDRIDASLRSVLKANYRPNFGLKNCSWPGNSFLSPVARDIWVDQANTCWSGVELGFASLLLYEGFRQEAEAVIRAVDRRYRKNGLYWDHQEYGGHYFRPMSSWAILHGYLGLGIRNGTLRFAPQMQAASFRLFFSTSSGTAHYIQTPNSIAVRCSTGKVLCNRLEIREARMQRVTLGGEPIEVRAIPTEDSGGLIALEFSQRIEIEAGDSLTLHRG